MSNDNKKTEAALFKGESDTKEVEERSHDATDNTSSDALDLLNRLVAPRLNVENPRLRSLQFFGPPRWKQQVPQTEIQNVIQTGRPRVPLLELVNLDGGGAGPTRASRSDPPREPGAYSVQPGDRSVRRERATITMGGEFFDDEPSPSDSLAEATPMVPLQEAEEYTADPAVSARKRFPLRWIVACASVLIGGMLICTGVLAREAAPFDEPVWSLSPNILSESPVVSLLPMSTIEAIRDDPSSAQARALDFVANDPNLDAMPNWRVQQRFALATLYHSTGGNEWKQNDGWVEYDMHECHWYHRGTWLSPGLRYNPSEVFQTNFSSPCDINAHLDVNASDGRYENLWLWANDLRGSLPPEMFLLTALRSINLDAQEERNRAHLEGSLPTEIGLCSRLEVLSLSHSNFTSLPQQIGQLSSLAYLRMEKSNLRGPLVSSIGLLTGLSYLDLHANPYLNHIPDEIVGMTSLKRLYLEGAYLDYFPFDAGSQLSNLLQLDLFDVLGPYAVKGVSVPAGIGTFSSLTDLKLGINSWPGPHPTEIGQLTNLEKLHLATSNGQGMKHAKPIPSHIGRLKHLKELSLVALRFMVGEIPSEVGLLASLEQLEVSSWERMGSDIVNGFDPQSGPPTFAIYNSPLSNSSLATRLPSELGMLTKLRRLNIAEASVYGSIPTEIGLMKGLKELKLTYPLCLTGNIPSELFLLTDLERLDLSGLWFSGQVPSELSLLTNLNYLTLNTKQADNTPLPAELLQLANLTIIMPDRWKSLYTYPYTFRDVVRRSANRPSP